MLHCLTDLPGNESCVKEGKRKQPFPLQSGHRGDCFHCCFGPALSGSNTHLEATIGKTPLLQ
jgi:hypothetical protein